MLNEERIRLMTKMASYEEGEGRKHMPIRKFYRRDYVGYEMLKTFLASTVAFGILLALWLIYNMENLTALVSQGDFEGIGVSVLLSYAGFVVVYQILACIVYNRRYMRASAGVKKYYSTLKKVERLAEKEERMQALEDGK